MYHCSTIVFPDVATVHATRKDRHDGTFRTVSYGREGTALTRAFEEAVAALEGAKTAVTLPCGMGAIATSLLAFLEAGDHLLMLDAVYGPAREFAENGLRKLGIDVEFYDPLIGADIAKLFRSNTKVVYLESPCSLSFEVQDVPAIAAAAKRRGVKVIVDNTWASPLFFKAIEHGADVSIHAATKYVSGFGYCAGPDDVYAALRGLRTLGVRMRAHQANALAVARWLQARPEVERVLYPALPEDPGHALWKRDFLGASGLLGVILKKKYSKEDAARMLDALDLFSLGYSWGGFESLAVPTFPETLRSATSWQQGPSIRLHVGLEDTADLTADLEQALRKLSKG